jgi:hypothetical protein
MGQLRYEKLHPEFGASLRGIDLGQPLAPVREIEGMSRAAGRAQIEELTLLHAGSGYDADRHRRYMRQTRVSATCSTLEEVG